MHAWMQGYVVVSEHGHFTTTDEQGAFILENVPVGDFEVELWHEFYGTKKISVSVAEGESSELSGSFDADGDHPKRRQTAP